MRCVYRGSNGKKQKRVIDRGERRYGKKISICGLLGAAGEKGERDGKHDDYAGEIHGEEEFSGGHKEE